MDDMSKSYSCSNNRKDTKKTSVKVGCAVNGILVEKFVLITIDNI